MHKLILKLAIPAILTNITVPLLGLVDLAIAGHVSYAGGSVSVLGAISVGGLIFNMVYWVFNFLRISTSGLTAQAFGREDSEAQREVLRLGLKIGLSAGLGILLLQWPILQIAHFLIDPSDEVWSLASTYYNIRVWGAPAVLMLFAVNGWLIGMQNSVYPMWLAIFQNLSNILLSALFVFVGHMGIAGIALGTLLSQWLGLAFIAALMLKKYRHILGPRTAGTSFTSRTAGTEAPTTSRTEAPTTSRTAPALALSSYFKTNLDIFFRMILMIVVTCSVTAIGARQGDLLLAVNTLLMQLFTLFSYFSDGFAAAGEALSGRFYGARQQQLLHSAVRRLFLWGFGIALLFTLLYALGGIPFLGLLTDDRGVLSATSEYLPWAIAIPLASFATFAWDGIYIGLTATRQMLWSIVWATLLFFAIYFGLEALAPLFPTLSHLGANHRLWLAFLVYLLTRSVAQTIMAPRLLK